ncbi:hypothetical protein TRIUR3_07911 [Triticum urartu]|uniref:Uncharacterized protein n=1 Tax=Triticum urartu TaxID=4572 RepID=M7Z5V4_TRIUA|nr:hypothetical protein TRIUR3_07911 [Triticum urartu]
MDLSRLPLVLLLCLLAGSPTTTLPVLPGIDKVQQQVNRANLRGPSIGLASCRTSTRTARSWSLATSGLGMSSRLLSSTFHMATMCGIDIMKND